MNWQILGVVAAVAFPLLGILNAYLLNQVRLEIGELKIQMLELRVKDREDTRMWIEAEFMRKAEAISRFDALHGRISRIENRRRDSDPRAA